MAASTSSSAMLVLLLFAAVVVISGSGVAVGAAAAEKKSALDQVCALLGGSYVTPALCASALCYDDQASPPCRDARDAAAVAALAARLLARNATATRDSFAAAAPSGDDDASATAGLRSCLQLYDGLVPALEWAAGAVAVAVAARRTTAYGPARELVQATRYAQRACAGTVGAEMMPRENGGFVTMAIVAHAVLSNSVVAAAKTG